MTDVLPCASKQGAIRQDDRAGAGRRQRARAADSAGRRPSTVGEAGWPPAAGAGCRAGAGWAEPAPHGDKRQHAPRQTSARNVTLTLS